LIRTPVTVELWLIEVATAVVVTEITDLDAVALALETHVDADDNGGEEEELAEEVALVEERGGHGAELAGGMASMEEVEVER
jgi:hypothetical protein